MCFPNLLAGVKNIQQMRKIFITPSKYRLLNIICTLLYDFWQRWKATYHNFSKALEDVAKVMISSGFFKITNKQSSCCFGVKFIYPFIQRAKFIFAFCFCKWNGGRVKREESVLMCIYTLWEKSTFKKLNLWNTGLKYLHKPKTYTPSEIAASC